MWLDTIRDNVAFLDTAPVIYFVEENPDYFDLVSPFFGAVASGEHQAITSVITLSETLVIPLRTGNVTLAGRYQEILSPDAGVDVYPITREIAEEAARIRAHYPRIRIPDALQMATAITAGAPYFLTNDAGLPNLPNLQILLVDQLAQK